MRKTNNQYPVSATYLLVVLFLLLSCETIAQSKHEQQYNRFQYHTFKWRTFHTEAYHIYFPVGNDSLCKYIASILPEAMERIKHRMITGLLKIPNVIIYPSQDQLYESNIGLFDPGEKTLPTFVSKGNRLVLFFNGSHTDLKDQLYEALARSVWESQLKTGLEEQAFGDNDKIPFWFSEGAIRYFAHQWPLHAEDELKRSFVNKDFKNWYEVIAYEPRLSGQAFCYFLTDQYYEQAAMQLFSQIKQKGALQRAIRLIAKEPLDSLLVHCFEYYQRRFAGEIHNNAAKAKQAIQLNIPRKKGIVKTVLISPDENNIAYVASKNNAKTVFNYNVTTNKTKKLSKYKLPPWVNDHSKDHYPLLDWSNNDLVVTQPHKGTVTTNKYGGYGTKLSGDKIIGIDGINTLEPEDNNHYLIAGYRKGQSDIVTYDANRERYTTRISDKYDDTYLYKDNNGKVAFVSTRPSGIEQDSSNKVLFQGIYNLKGKDIEQVITDTVPYVEWNKPAILNNGKVLATTTAYGTERFALLQMNASNYRILNDHTPIQYLLGSEQVSEYSITHDSIQITLQPTEQWIKNKGSNTRNAPWLIDYRKHAAQRAKEDSLLNSLKNSTPSFLEKILVPKQAKEQAKQRQDSIMLSLQYDPKKVRPYILQLHSAYFSARVNNDYFINRYQPYLNYQGQFKFPEVGGMAQGGFTDLFENHHISVGFRVPAGTEGSDFFVNYRNTAKKLDWGLTYFRKVENLQPDPDRLWVNEDGKTYPGLAKVKTHYYELSLHYPLTYYLSIGLDEAIRTDRTIFLATDEYSLVFEDIKSTWSITSLSLKQNKLKATIPLLFRGYVAKLFIDAFKGFSQQENALYGLKLKLEHHLPIYKYITLVTRAQAGHSAGSSHILYNMGGLDNNLTVKVDSNTHFSQTAPYAFQSLVTPFRGYLQNRLYGNQYAVFNADVYFPVFQSLIPIETKLSFINHLQLGLFSDIGTANETWSIPPKSNPWLWSYGLCARTILAGYPIRVDVAWPGALNKQPVWYFSLNAQ